MTAIHLLSEDAASLAAWLARSEALHRSFRSAIPGDYAAYLGRMFAEGADMAVLHLAGEPKALAVFRTFHTTFQGRRFYIDDLVTTEAERGAGHGTALLAWCEARARALGCQTFALDSGVHRSAAHRFYFRNRMTIGGFGFTKPLQGA